MVTQLEKYGPINSIVLSRSVESDNVYLRDEQSVTDDGLCEIKIVDNQIMNFNNRSDFLQGILNALDGLYYYINDFNSTGILYYEVGDLYNVQVGETTYQCLMLNDEVNVTTGIEEIIHTDMPIQSETDYEKADKTDIRINQTYLIVDKQNQTIESVVNNVSEQNNKISQITQTVDDINSKIQDIADITTYGESDSGIVELTNINESEPIMIKVHSTSNNISYVYPRSNLYPSDTLYMTSRIVRFINTQEYRTTSDTYYNNYREYFSYDSTDNEYTLLVAGTDYIIGNAISGIIYENVYIDYELPDDLLRYSSTVYDEFYLDYDSTTCQVIKKCEYNADGTVSALGTEVTTDYSYPTIGLGDGDYEILLLNYDYGYLYVRLMAKNIYTTQFYTKYETNSKIEQKANEITSTVSATYERKDEALTAYTQINQNINSINLEVGRKLDEGNFTGANIMLAINNDASSATIDADKISLNGKTIDMTAQDIEIQSNNFNVDKYGNITANSGTMGGWTLSSTGLVNNDGTIYIRNNGFSSIYTYADLVIARNYLMGYLMLTETDISEHYDVNNDGVVNSGDLVYLRRKILGLD